MMSTVTTPAGETGRAQAMRDRQRRFAMAEIERTALDLFAARGFDAVTVDEIVAAAGTSQRTFFRYFSSKDDVVLTYERHLHERFMAALRARPEQEGPVTALRRAYVATSHVAPDDVGPVLMRARVVASAPVLHRRAVGERRLRINEIAAVLVEREHGVGIEASTGEQRRRARVIAASLSGVAHAEWDAWVASGDTTNPAASIEQAIDLLVGGLPELDRPGSARPRAPRRTKRRERDQRDRTH